MSALTDAIRHARRIHPDATHAQIGRIVGASQSHVWKTLNADAVRERNLADARAYKARNRERLREYDARYTRQPEHRGTCMTCGALMGIGRKADGTCKPCLMAARAARGQQIVEWWADGLKLQEICDRLGWTKGHISMEMHRLRADGYDLPHRYRLRSAA